MVEKLTIKDIARLAGVSKATVSRVLNQKPDVDSETRERILRIMEDQSFVPSIAASGLAGGRNRLLGALVPSLSWPLVPELVRGVGESIGSTSYELILYSITDDNHEKDHSAIIDRIIGNKLVSGLLGVFPGLSTSYLIKLHSPDFPVVMVDDQVEPVQGVPWISVDNWKGAYDATLHLIRLGHSRIAHIQGPLKYLVSRDRYQGYCDALRERGVPLDPALVLEADFRPPIARICTNTLLELPAWQRPTAIFAASDYMAYGAISAAKQHGMRVPEDLAIVGFDDNVTSAHMEPALTTVHQPFYEMGRRASELLLSLVEAPHPVNGPNYNGRMAEPSSLTSRAVHFKMPANLIVRSSCGASQGVSIDK